MDVCIYNAPLNLPAIYWTRKSRCVSVCLGDCHACVMTSMDTRLWEYESMTWDKHAWRTS